MVEEIHPYIFIIGSPRSGTTILGQVLSTHPDIAQWHEPYFIWDREAGKDEDDYRTPADLTETHRRFIQREFAIYHRKTGRRILVDKSPLNCLRVSFVNAVFPKAKFVHIVRDGRAATLSIRNEWLKWSEYKKKTLIRRVCSSAGDILEYQPFWRNRMQAIWYVLRNHAALNPQSVSNRTKWGKHLGWGSRFPGWERALESVKPLEFNAMQWTKAVDAIASRPELRGGLASN